MPRSARWMSAPARSALGMAAAVPRVSEGFAISACPGKVETGFPIRTCARPRNLERAAQGFIEQALVDQPVPIERFLEFADRDEPVGDGGPPLLREITAPRMLRLVIFGQDGARFRQAHLPHLGVDARSFLAVAIDELDRLAMDVEDFAQRLRILSREFPGRHRDLPGEFRII